MGVEPKNNGKTPKSSILIGVSIIFTIHFGGFPPIFGNIHMSTSLEKLTPNLQIHQVDLMRNLFLMAFLGWKWEVPTNCFFWVLLWLNFLNVLTFTTFFFGGVEFLKLHEITNFY